jgi:hypothetical protein
MVARMRNREQLPRRFSTNSTWILSQRPYELDKQGTCSVFNGLFLGWLDRFQSLNYCVITLWMAIDDSMFVLISHFCFCFLVWTFLDDEDTSIKGLECRMILRDAVTCLTMTDLSAVRRVFRFTRTSSGYFSSLDEIVAKEPVKEYWKACFIRLQTGQMSLRAFWALSEFVEAIGCQIHTIAATNGRQTQDQLFLWIIRHFMVLAGMSLTLLLKWLLKRAALTLGMAVLIYHLRCDTWSEKGCWGPRLSEWDILDCLISEWLFLGPFWNTGEVIVGFPFRHSYGIVHLRQLVSEIRPFSFNDK